PGIELPGVRRGGDLLEAPSKETDLGRRRAVARADMNRRSTHLYLDRSLAVDGVLRSVLEELVGGQRETAGDIRIIHDPHIELLDEAADERDEACARAKSKLEPGRSRQYRRVRGARSHRTPIVG